MKITLLLIALCVPTIAFAQPAPVTPAAAGGALTDAQLAARLPLPVLATIDLSSLATSVGQTTGNASLASIDAKLANPLPVSLASVPSHAVTNVGTFAVQCTSGCAAGLPGQQVMALSSPVVIASDQTTIPVTATLAAETTKVIGTINMAAAQSIGLSGTLPAFAVIPAFKIDQTTPGTTNAVAVTNSFGLEATLQSVKTAVELIDNCISGARCLVTEDNSALIKAALDTLNAAVSTAAKQDTGNGSLASIKTNTDPLVASGAGGYVRQDSTATIAKESGGNLATVATNSALQATAANQTTELTYLATLAGTVLTRSAVTPSTPALLVQTANFGPPLPLPLCNAVRRYNCQPKTW